MFSLHFICFDPADITTYMYIQTHIHNHKEFQASVNVCSLVPSFPSGDMIGKKKYSEIQELITSYLQDVFKKLQHIFL